MNLIFAKLLEIMLNFNEMSQTFAKLNENKLNFQSNAYLAIFLNYVKVILKLQNYKNLTPILLN